jgi:hypothetical protein
MHHKHEALWLLKNYKLYTLGTLILYNTFCLIVGSRLILIQNLTFDFKNVVMQI